MDYDALLEIVPDDELLSPGTPVFLSHTNVHEEKDAFVVCCGVTGKGRRTYTFAWEPGPLDERSIFYLGRESSLGKVEAVMDGSFSVALKKDGLHVAYMTSIGGPTVMTPQHCGPEYYLARKMADAV